MAELGRMNKPPHPGEVLKGLWLDELNLTISETAKAMDVSRVAVSEIVNGRRGISTDMAFRLSKAFDTSPDVWINMQKTYDLWKSEHRSKTFLKTVHSLVQ